MVHNPHKTHKPRIIPHVYLGHETHMAWYPIATHGLPATGLPPATHDPPATHGRQAYEPHMAYVPHMTNPAHMPASRSHMCHAPPHWALLCHWLVSRPVGCVWAARPFCFFFALQTPLQNKICCVCIIIRALFVCCVMLVEGDINLWPYTPACIYM